MRSLPLLSAFYSCRSARRAGQPAGFTLIELLVVIALIGVISVLAVPFIQSFQSSSDFYTQAHAIAATLRRAQQQAASGQGAAGWGVQINDASKELTLYQGQTFATRDAGFDQIETYRNAFVATTDFAQNEISFAAGSGLPSASGSVQFIGPNTGEQAAVLVNAVGKIELQR